MFEIASKYCISDFFVDYDGYCTRPKSGMAAERSNPTSKEWLLLGAGGLRGATPCSRSGGAAVRRYPSSKVRSSGCALLEQP